jgi:oligoribonuclease NrnB/cAMP/cGMP phosphodiesterase (DHH superfamily)
MNNKALIIYHADCIDGLAAAWTTQRALAGTDCIFIAYDHAEGAAAENAVRAALGDAGQVYFVDIGPRAEFLAELRQAAPAVPVTVIDHHVSSSFELAQVPPQAGLKVKIDTHHPSAANMVWEHFFPAEEKPFFLEMIGKMDLGHDMQTEDDFAAAAAIDAYDISSPEKAFDSFEALQRLTAKDLIQSGKAESQQQETYGTEVRKTLEHLTVDMPDATQAVLPAVMLDKKKIGRRMSLFLCAIAQNDNTDAAIGWAVKPDGKVAVSLRSAGKADCSVIAKHLAELHGVNGGGHRCSAAVTFNSMAHFRKALPPSPPMKAVKSLRGP